MRMTVPGAEEARRVAFSAPLCPECDGTGVMRIPRAACHPDASTCLDACRRCAQLAELHWLEKNP